MLDGEPIVDLGAMTDIYAEWDSLAIACALPQMSPAWLMAWWRHLAPESAVPRVIAVRDAGRLVGLAPFFVEPGKGGRVDYRLPGIELAVRLAPLAIPGREWEVAESFAHVLAETAPTPDVIALEGGPLASHWPTALRERWQGPVRPIVSRYAIYGCPTVTLSEPSYEEWLSGKSAHFANGCVKRGANSRRPEAPSGWGPAKRSAPTLRPCCACTPTDGTRSRV